MFNGADWGLVLFVNAWRWILAAVIVIGGIGYLIGRFL